MNTNNYVLLIAGASPWALVTQHLNHHSPNFKAQSKYSLISNLHARSPAGLVGTEVVGHPVLEEQSVPVHVDAVEEGIVHVPLLGRQHSVVHPPNIYCKPK